MSNLPDTIFMTEAMERWKCDRKAIDKGISDGLIIAFKPGKRKLIDVESGDKWFLASQIKPKRELDIKTGKILPRGRRRCR